MRTKFEYFNRVLLNKAVRTYIFILKIKINKKCILKGKNNFANESKQNEHVYNMIIKPERI